MSTPRDDGAAAAAQDPGRSTVETPHAPAASREAAPMPPVRLTAEQAQAVISRALDLQLGADRQDSDGLTLADLTEIAGQVGVDPSLVPRAMADVRLSSARTWEPSRTERILGPHRISDATILPAPVDQVREAVAAWMTGDEAMRVTGTRGDTERWAKDKRLLVELRRGLSAGRADGTLRGLPSVAVRTSPDPAGTMVTIDADTSAIRRASMAILAVTAVGGIGIGIGNAAIIPDTAAIASDLGQFAVSFGAVAAAGTTTAVAVATTWTSKVRRAVDHALEGISMRSTRPELLPQLAPPTGWRKTVLRWLGGTEELPRP